VSKRAVQHALGLHNLPEMLRICGRQIEKGQKSCTGITDSGIHQGKDVFALRVKHGRRPGIHVPQGIFSCRFAAIHLACRSRIEVKGLRLLDNPRIF